MSWQGLLTSIRKSHPKAEIQQHDGGTFTIHHCGDPLTEHEGLVNSAGLIVSPNYYPIMVEGDDAVNYLQRRLSQDIEGLPVGRGCHALQLGGDGKMLADVLVYRGNEALFVLVERSHASATLELIGKYVLNDHVEVHKHWEAEAVLGLAGPSAPDLIDALIDPAPPGGRLNYEQYDAVFTVTLAGLPCRVLSDARWGFPYFHILIPPMAMIQLAREINSMCVEWGGGMVGAKAVEMVRIEAGIPKFGLDTNEDTIPLDACLYDAVHFNKGCYPGQEVMARINNLGHPARQLVRLSLDDEQDLAAGTTLQTGDDVAGELSSAATLPGLGRTEALGYLKWPHRQLTELTTPEGIKFSVSQIRPEV